MISIPGSLSFAKFKICGEYQITRPKIHSFVIPYNLDFHLC